MASRILVFESDASFARELRRGLERAGGVVEIVSQVDNGIDRALASAPALILVSAELREDGYLVCKRIRRDPVLGSTPVIMLSAAANADTVFEQHRKLKARASDYVKKSDGIDTLVERCRTFVQLDDAASTETLDIDVDDVLAEHGANRAADSRFDSEIDDFAEAAFSSLVADEDATVVGVIPSGLAAVAPTTASHRVERTSSRPADARADESAEANDGRGEQNAALEAVMRTAREESEGLRVRVRELEGQLLDAERISRENIDLKARLGGAKSAGVSSREFLDLREALNRKDKELLELKDQLSSRDKQIVDLRDRGIAVERREADYQDRISDLEAKVQEQTAHLEAFAKDKDAGAKRVEDMRSRMERAEARGKKLESELEESKSAAARAADEHRSELGRTVESESEKTRQALAEAEAQRQELESRLSEAARVRESELSAAHHAALAEAFAGFERTKAGLDAEHVRTLAAAELKAGTDLRVLSETHAEALEQSARAQAQQLETALAALAAQHQAELAALRTGLVTERDAKLADLDMQHSAARSALVARHEDALHEAATMHETQVAQLTEQLAATEQARSLAIVKSDGLEEQLSFAQETHARELEAHRGAFATLQVESSEQIASLSSELAALQASSAEALRAAKQAHEDEVLGVTNQSRLVQETLEEQARAALRDADERRVRELAAAEERRQGELGELEARRQSEVAAVEQARASEVAAAEERRASEVAAAEERRASEVTTLEELRKREVAELEARLSNELAALQERRTRELAESESTHAAEVERLVSQSANERTEMSARFEAEIAILSKQSVDHRDRASALEMDLARVTSESEKLSAEVSHLASQAASQATRLGTLEETLRMKEAEASALLGRVAALSEKVASDEEMIARVQKAMTIGAALLQDRKPVPTP